MNEADTAVKEEVPLNEADAAVKEVLSDKAADFLNEADAAAKEEVPLNEVDAAVKEEVPLNEADAAVKEALSDKAANEEVLSEKAADPLNEADALVKEEVPLNEADAVKEEVPLNEADAAVKEEVPLNEVDAAGKEEVPLNEADAAGKEVLSNKAADEEAPNEPDAGAQESETGVKNVHDDQDGGKPHPVGVEGPPSDLVQQIIDQHQNEVVSHVDANTAVQQADERREELPVVQFGKDTDVRQDLFFPDTLHSQTFFTPELNNFQDVDNIKGGFQGAYLAPAQAQPWEMKEETPGNLRGESSGSSMVAVAGLSLVGVFSVFALRKCLVKRADPDSFAPLTDHKSA